MPWLYGSAGTLFFDFTVCSQDVENTIFFHTDQCSLWLLDLFAILSVSIQFGMISIGWPKKSTILAGGPKHVWLPAHASHFEPFFVLFDIYEGDGIDCIITHL